MRVFYRCIAINETALLTSSFQIKYPKFMKTHFSIFLLLTGVFLAGCSPSDNAEEDKAVEPTQNEPDPIKLVKHEVPVLGWHQVHSGVQDYNYDVLNMLAYFSYKIDPSTGENTRNNTWDTDPIIDSAQANNCKIFLTLENFGFANNTEFLNNSSAQNQLIDNVSLMITKRNANGVCIDFEEIHENDGTAFNDFLIKLSDTLKQNNKEVIVVLPLYYPENVATPEKLGDKVDYFIMMGYACHHNKSTYAGPISPWRSGDIWAPYSIEPNLDNYLANNFTPEKFMVALPTYGGKWQTESTEIKSKRIADVEGVELTYNTIMNDVTGKEIGIDSTGMSSYYTYQDGGKSYQYWFESKENIDWKIQQLMNKKLAGIGFWALGYASEHPDFWTGVGESVQLAAAE